MSGEEIIVGVVVALCVIYVVWRLFGKRRRSKCQGCSYNQECGKKSANEQKEC